MHAYRITSFATINKKTKDNKYDKPLILITYIAGAQPRPGHPS